MLADWSLHARDGDRYKAPSCRRLRRARHDRPKACRKAFGTALSSQYSYSNDYAIRERNNDLLRASEQALRRSNEAEAEQRKDPAASPLFKRRRRHAADSVGACADGAKS